MLITSTAGKDTKKPELSNIASKNAKTTSDFGK
jgi:hypothetical protein